VQKGCGFLAADDADAEIHLGAGCDFFSSIQSAIAAQEGRSLLLSANQSAIQRQQRHGKLWRYLKLINIGN
jgi:hypothetical protein